MTDTIIDEDEQTLRKCSDCRSTMLLKYFGENKKGELFKCCANCLKKRGESRKAKSPEYKAKAAIQRKIYNDSRKEKTSEVGKLWYENNKEKKLSSNKNWYNNNKEQHKELTKRWVANNQEHIKEIRKKYNEEHKEQHKEWCKLNIDKNREVARKWTAIKKANDPAFKLLINMRNRLSQTIRHGYKSEATKELLGCTSDELKIHIENKFTEGMTWDKYGTNGFHIDHILPCASFNLLDPDEQKKCFHYTNLQPLWAIDNLKKGSKIL
jgi:hypothetical protein